MYNYMLQEAILPQLWWDVKPDDDEMIFKLAIKKRESYKPTYVIHPDGDTIVAVDQADEAVKALQEVGAEVVYERLPGLDHLYDEDPKYQLEDILYEPNNKKDKSSYDPRCTPKNPHASPFERLGASQYSTSTWPTNQQTESGNRKTLPDACANHRLVLGEHVEAHRRQRDDDATEKKPVTIANTIIPAAN
ncbi:hypothetical protein V495_04723 [Pseudogymnoascus sp. VKM F-4514 (FW-929)]|nr:hypothetical protein V495_04723 [Pseudogymnoascus sp. VKM F-4514 (FW-929)]KFY61641.1 hypothetical protein V497_02832 [Pseudogymnoascus sp. VKM F-4516 (FW-969)]